MSNPVNTALPNQYTSPNPATIPVMTTKIKVME